MCQINIINQQNFAMTVSERTKCTGGKVQQKIRNYYKFVGLLDELHIDPTKRWMILPVRRCDKCGMEFVPGSAVAKYCPVLLKRNPQTAILWKQAPKPAKARQQHLLLNCPFRANKAVWISTEFIFNTLIVSRVAKIGCFCVKKVNAVALPAKSKKQVA